MDSGPVLADSEASTTVCMPLAGCQDQVPVSCSTVKNNDLIAPAYLAKRASNVLVRTANALAVPSGCSAQVSSNRPTSAGIQAMQHPVEQQYPAIATAMSTPVISAPQTESAKTAQSQQRQRPPSSQQPGAICRQDLSGVAMLLQSSMANHLSASENVAISTLPETDANSPQPPAKRHKKVFVHGNYKAYYGYRLGTELTEDPRLQVKIAKFSSMTASSCQVYACNCIEQVRCVLELALPLLTVLIREHSSKAARLSMQVLDRRWFHNKRCLDIGCNEGVITLAVVQRFAPLSMLGVDIDEGLVKAACRYAALLCYSRQTHYCFVARGLQCHSIMSGPPHVIEINSNFWTA